MCLKPFRDLIACHVVFTPTGKKHPENKAGKTQSGLTAKSQRRSNEVGNGEDKMKVGRFYTCLNDHGRVVMGSHGDM